MSVCVVGSVNHDVTLRMPSIPRPGDTVLAAGRSDAHGGKGGNQAVAVAACGVPVTLVGAVGSDPAGGAARRHLARHGIDLRLTTVEARTGTATVLVADDGENLIVVDPGANALLDPATVAREVSGLHPRVLLAQLEVPVPAVLAAARSTPAQFVLNPAPLPDDPAGTAALLAETDVLVPNRGELARLGHRPEPTTPAEVDACAAALDVPVLVVTLGADGVVVYADGERHVVPPVVVDATDTSGAGDVFCGVLAALLASGVDLLDAARAANRAAAVSTTLPGAQVPAAFRALLPGLPDSGGGPAPL